MPGLGTKITDQWLPIVPDTASVTINLEKTRYSSLDDQRDKASAVKDSVITDVGLFAGPSLRTKSL